MCLRFSTTSMRLMDLPRSIRLSPKTTPRAACSSPCLILLIIFWGRGFQATPTSGGTRIRPWPATRPYGVSFKSPRGGTRFKKVIMVYFLNMFVCFLRMGRGNRGWRCGERFVSESSSKDDVYLNSEGAFGGHGL